jgi:glyoxalase/bleomycin resistance protein/dioxygenase superfamily protein
MTADRLAGKYGLTFHHLGLAVRQTDTAAAFLANLGYSVGPTVYDPTQNVHVCLCEHPVMPIIEIICPGEGKSPIDRYLREHKEGLIYHMCFAAKDLTASIAELKADAQVKAIFWAKPQAAVLFGGRKIAFGLIDGIGLIELLAETI